MVTLLTPTRNRPEAFSLLETWVERQTYRGAIQWIIVNDGESRYEYRLGQTVVCREAGTPGLASLKANLAAGLRLARGDKILFLEDDDWVSPEYVATVADWLDSADLAGSVPAVYYNLATRLTRTYENPTHASLGQTGLRRDLLPWFQGIVGGRNEQIDFAAWFGCPGIAALHRNETNLGNPLHVSMKSLPGEPGIGVGHRLRSGYYDQNFDRLRQMLGSDDAGHYINLSGMPKCMP